MPLGELWVTKIKCLFGNNLLRFLLKYFAKIMLKYICTLKKWEKVRKIKIIKICT